MKIKFTLITFLMFFTSLLSFSQEWEKIFPDSQIIIAPGFSIGFEVINTSDGGYLIGGETDYATGAIRHYSRVAKTDEFGNTEWDSTYHEWAVTSQEVQLLDELSDGNFIVGGNQFGVPYLMKINPDGVPIWEKTYPSDTSRHTFGGIVCPDGGFLLIGQLIVDFGIPSDIFMLKIDSLGEVLWERKHTFSNATICYGIDNTSDGGFILVGSIGNELTLFKTNSFGILDWDRSYNFSTADQGFVVKQTLDNGFILGGATTGIATNLPLVFKTDSLGNGEWSSILANGIEGQVTDIELTPDGGYATVGNIQTFWGFNSNGFLLKLDTDGNEEWREDFNSDNQNIASIANTSDGGFIMAGRDEDGMLLKKIGGTTSQKNILTNTFIDIFPNPTSDQTTFHIQTEKIKTIHLQVFDSVGKLIRSEVHDTPSVIFDAQKLPSGIYFYQLKNEKGFLGNGKLFIAR